MATGTKTIPREPGRAATVERAAAGLGFNWAMALICGWVLIGLYVDGWAHNHLASTLETFFTPWHAILYSGMLIALVVLTVTLVRGRRQGHAWLDALPDGYLPSWIGAVLFGVAGVADMFWHITFGIEVTTEALLSPPHLLLAFSGALVMTGPLRAAWKRDDVSGRWADWLPALLSLLWVMSVLTFFTLYAHPVRTPWASVAFRVDPDRQGWIMGVSGFVVQAALMSAVVLFVLRRWPSMPPGSLTLLLTANMALVSVIGDQYRFILAAVLAGVVGDIILWQMRPPGGATRAARWLGFGVPFVFTLGYFAILILGEGTWWRVSLWGGSTVIAGVIGWLISFLVFPPATGEKAQPA